MLKYRELDEIQLQAQADFEQLLQSFEEYMLGNRKMVVDEGGTEDGDLYGEEERQYIEGSQEPGAFPVGIAPA